MSIMLLDGLSPRRADSLQDEHAWLCMKQPGLRQMDRCRYACVRVCFLYTNAHAGLHIDKGQVNDSVLLDWENLKI